MTTQKRPRGRQSNITEDTQERILKMFYVDGQDIKTVAKTFGITVGSCAYLLFKNQRRFLMPRPQLPDHRPSQTRHPDQDNLSNDPYEEVDSA